MNWSACGLLCAALVLALGQAPAQGKSRRTPAPAAQTALRDSKARTPPPVQPSAPVARGRLYAVVLGPGTAWKRGQPFKGPGLDEHRRYWKRMLDEGRVASAGPLGGDTGLALVRARSQSEADALVAADPAVRARILRGVARPYRAELVSAAVLTAD